MVINLRQWCAQTFRRAGVEKKRLAFMLQNVKKERVSIFVFQFLGKCFLWVFIKLIRQKYSIFSAKKSAYGVRKTCLSSLLKCN